MDINIVGDFIVRNDKRVGNIWSTGGNWFCRIYIDDKSLMFRSKENAVNFAIDRVRHFDDKDLFKLESETTFQKSKRPTSFHDNDNETD